jgi:hypothetical protein
MKSYHLGHGSSAALSTLAKANIRKNYKIYKEFACHLIDYARSHTLYDVKTQIQVLFTLPRLQLMMLMQWIKSPMKKVIITFFIGIITTLNGFTESN